MSLDSYVSRKDSNIASMMSPRGTELEDNDFILKQVERSKVGRQNQYMSTLQSGAKIRGNISSSNFPKPNYERTSNGSSSSLSSQGFNRHASTHSAHSERGGMSKGHPSRKSNGNPPPPSSSYNSRPPTRSSNITEIRDALIRRIQDNSYRARPDELQDVLSEVIESCKSTKLNLDAVVQWKLGRLDHTTESSVIDHLFLMNMNIMGYDIKYSRSCVEKYCHDPLCCDIHKDSISEYDKARAFRRVLNIIMNEAIRAQILKKDQKVLIRARLVKSHFIIDDRIGVIREMALLIMLGQTDRYKGLAIYGIVNAGIPWSPPPEIASDLDRECSLDPEKVYRKAVSASFSPFMESILDVKRLGLGVTNSEVSSLLGLWVHVVSVPGMVKKLTIPMLLHILVHCSENELQKSLSEAAMRDGLQIQADRINQIEDAALQAVQNLGLAWELGDNPPKDLRQLCMALVMDVGSTLSKFVIRETSFSQPSSNDSVEIGFVEDGLFNTWFDTCNLFVRTERARKGFLISLLLSYLSITSERLLSQKADFNPEMYLTIMLELLTEFRKRRPNYKAICISPDRSLVDSRDVDGKPIELDRTTKESIGSEFDRLYAWVDPNIPVANRVRSLVLPVSPKSSAQAEGKGDGSVFQNGVQTTNTESLHEAALVAADLSESMNSQLHY
ncbi:hypothetical protein AYI68_g1291 [Smittium mucronatum]|uniref:Uncharacterized protein n=1 Tax=Smittium mucronatum TaxID=133383 RepID=A0A1R0H628_9FUNG|nr:hypothetical protein AYI68_g1291 [Smittium mucronatum]